MLFPTHSALSWFSPCLFACLYHDAAWPFALASTISARTCTGFMVTAKAGLALWELACALRNEGADTPRRPLRVYLLAIVTHIPALLGFIAAWPSAAYVLVSMTNSGSLNLWEASNGGVNYHAFMLPIAIGTGAEVALVLIAALIGAVADGSSAFWHNRRALRQAAAASSDGQVTQAGEVAARASSASVKHAALALLSSFLPAARTAKQVLLRGCMARLGSWYVGCAWTAAYVMMRWTAGLDSAIGIGLQVIARPDNPNYPKTARWTNLFLAVLYAAPIVALLLGMTACLGLLRTLYQLVALQRQQRRAMDPRHLAASGSSGELPVIVAQRMSAIGIKRAEVTFLSYWTFGSLVTCGLLSALARELTPVAAVFGTTTSPFDAWVAVNAVTSQVFVAGSSTAATRIVGLWMGVHLSLMVSLVLLAHGLQDVWDAEDRQAMREADLTDTQREALTRARSGEAAAMAAAIPHLLDRVADGLYKRASDDTAGRKLGVQVITNPLHAIRDVRQALKRRNHAQAEAAKKRGEEEEAQPLRPSADGAATTTTMRLPRGGGRAGRRDEDASTHQQLETVPEESSTASGASRGSGGGGVGGPVSPSHASGPTTTTARVSKARSWNPTSRGNSGNTSDDSSSRKEDPSGAPAVSSYHRHNGAAAAAGGRASRSLSTGVHSRIAAADTRLAGSHPSAASASSHTGVGSSSSSSSTAACIDMTMQLRMMAPYRQPLASSKRHSPAPPPIKLLLGGSGRNVIASTASAASTTPSTAVGDSVKLCSQGNPLVSLAADCSRLPPPSLPPPTREPFTIASKKAPASHQQQLQLQLQLQDRGSPSLTSSSTSGATTPIEVPPVSLQPPSHIGRPPTVNDSRRLNVQSLPPSYSNNSGTGTRNATNKVVPRNSPDRHSLAVQRAAAAANASTTATSTTAPSSRQHVPLSKLPSFSSYSFVLPATNDVIDGMFPEAPPMQHFARGERERSGSSQEKDDGRTAAVSRSASMPPTTASGGGHSSRVGGGSSRGHNSLAVSSITSSSSSGNSSKGSISSTSGSRGHLVGAASALVGDSRARSVTASSVLTGGRQVINSQPMPPSPPPLPPHPPPITRGGALASATPQPASERLTSGDREVGVDAFVSDSQADDTLGPPSLTTPIKDWRAFPLNHSNNRNSNNAETTARPATSYAGGYLHPYPGSLASRPATAKDGQRGSLLAADNRSRSTSRGRHARGGFIAQSGPNAAVDADADRLEDEGQVSIPVRQLHATASASAAVGGQARWTSPHPPAGATTAPYGAMGGALLFPSPSSGSTPSAAINTGAAPHTSLSGSAYGSSASFRATPRALRLASGVTSVSNALRHIASLGRTTSASAAAAAAASASFLGGRSSTSASATEGDVTAAGVGVQGSRGEPPSMMTMRGHVRIDTVRLTPAGDSRVSFGSPTTMTDGHSAEGFPPPHASAGSSSSDATAVEVAASATSSSVNTGTARSRVHQRRGGSGSGSAGGSSPSTNASAAGTVASAQLLVPTRSFANVAYPGRLLQHPSDSRGGGIAYVSGGPMTPAGSPPPRSPHGSPPPVAPSLFPLMSSLMKPTASRLLLNTATTPAASSSSFTASHGLLAGTPLSRTGLSVLPPHLSPSHLTSGGGGGTVGGGGGSSTGALAWKYSHALITTPLPHGGRPACFICYETSADAVFMECGHAGVCSQCAKTITHGFIDPQSGAATCGSGTCPICRTPVLQVLRIGPDVTSSEGHVVAQVLPDWYWSTATGSNNNSNSGGSEHGRSAASRSASSSPVRRSRSHQYQHAANQPAAVTAGPLLSLAPAI